MSEYYMSHSGAELDEAISKVKNGYLLPSGEIEITKNGSYDVSDAASAVVDVPKIKYTSGTVVVGTDITGVSEYSENEFYIDVGFAPKLFIFKQPNYTASSVTGIASAEKNVCISSLYRSAGLNGTDSDYFDVTYIRKDTGNVITSASAYGFRPSADGTKMIFLCSASSFAFLAGTWRWEAYE